MRLYIQTLSSTRKWMFFSFLFPFLIMSLIYAAMKVYPFGGETLLTVDLGQQYVDFYNYYRQTLLTEPEALFYSFSKAIGGEMTGLWAYYLTSPFNLLLLLFPQRYLSVAVACLILLKISFSGLSFSYLLINRFHGRDFQVLLFSLSYSLMGYVLANQLNVMWLDGLVFLPLIIAGLENLIAGKKGVQYSVWLAVMLFANYYIGYMICIFLIFYYFFALVRLEWDKTATVKSRLKNSFLRTASFAGYSLLAAGSAAFLLAPTFYVLLGSKASYTNTTVDWSFAYPPAEAVSKFYIGAFNFDQMPSGHPNLYIGSVGLIMFLHYFTNKAFSYKERIVSAVLTVIFFLSMNIQILNKIWHAGQYPIWYPYRFSFLVCFFLLVNGFRSMNSGKKLSFSVVTVLLLLQIAASLYLLEKNLDFLYPSQIIASAILFVIAVILLLLRENDIAWLPYALIGFTVAEMTANAAIDLTRLSYVDQFPFQDYLQVLDSAVEDLKPAENDFYRIEKTFQRSKNDSFQEDYAGIAHFSSTFEKEVPLLFGELGFPDGDGFITYSTGTMFTDAFFGVKYLIDSQELPAEVYQSGTLYQINRTSTRTDLTQYPLVSENERTLTYQNPNALSLGFVVDESLADLVLDVDDPVANQEMLLKTLDNSAVSEAYFQERYFTAQVSQNVSTAGLNDGSASFEKINDSAEAKVEFQFVPETDDPYYLVLDGSVDEDNAEFYLNGEKLDYYDTYRNDQVLNIASGQQGETVSFTMELLEDDLRLEDFHLYEFQLPQFEEVIAQTKQEQLTISSFSQTDITGSVTVPRDQSLLLFTIPFSEGWEVLVDGQSVETQKVLESLLAVEITPGTHSIELQYRSPFLGTGIAISLTSAGILTVLRYKPKHAKKHRV